MRIARPPVLVVLAIVGTILATSPTVVLASPATTFTTIDFPGASGTQPTGINNSGEIVGFYCATTINGGCGGVHGFSLAKGSFSRIDFPGAIQTLAKGVNNRGDIVGGYCTAEPCSAGIGTSHGLLLANGGFTVIDFPGAVQTGASGINDHGDIVGLYQDASGKIHGFLLERDVDHHRHDEVDRGQARVDASADGGDPEEDAADGQFAKGSFSAIDFPDAIETEAEGINNRGEIVGEYKDASGKFHGFSLAKGSFTTIDPPATTFTLALGINNLGEIVGGYQDVLGNQHGFLLAKGGFTIIDFPGAFATAASGINNRGKIVGVYFVGTLPFATFHGFLRH